MDVTLRDALATCAQALARGNGASAAYDAVEAGLRETVGHRLFTLLALSPSGGEVVRFHSSDPVAYPVTGRKTIGDTPLGRQVLGEGRPFLGRTAEDIRWAFADHALIESLGLRSVINVPVMEAGRVLGMMNLLDVEDHYAEADIRVAELFAPCLVPGFRDQATRIA